MTRNRTGVVFRIFAVALMGALTLWGPTGCRPIGPEAANGCRPDDHGCTETPEHRSAPIDAATEKCLEFGCSP